MLSKKNLNAKIANMEAKLKPLYRQIDQLCSKLNKQQEAKRSVAGRPGQSRSRGRPPKEGVHKLSELQQKLQQQSEKWEHEVEKAIRTVNKQIKDLNAEIEQRKMLLDRI